MFLKLRVNDGEYIVKISKDIVKQVCEVIWFRLVKVRHEVRLITM